MPFPSLIPYAIGVAVRLLCAFTLLTGASAAYAGPTEYEIKAAFVYNFAKFVEWPADSAPLRLCVFGKDPIVRALEQIKGNTVKERKVEVLMLDATMDVRECNLLFIVPSMEKHLDRIVAISRGAGMLTVSDTDGYAQRGVMINIFTEKGKFRFEINLDAVQRGGLKISSKLLSLARIVTPGKYGD